MDFITGMRRVISWGLIFSLCIFPVACTALHQVAPAWATTGVLFADGADRGPTPITFSVTLLALFVFATAIMIDPEKKKDE